MAIKSFYRITIPKFNTHNKELKPSHKKTLISNNFCNDAKLLTLPLSVRWLFLNLVLTCGDHTSDTVEIGEKRLREMLESSWSIPRALDSLKELQLLSYDKIDPLINRIERNRKEKKGSSAKGAPKSEASPPAASPPVPDKRSFIAFYCDQWKSRYGSNPPISGAVSGMLTKFLQDHGELKGRRYIEAYLKMPDSWFVTKRHDVPTLLTNLNAVAHFAESGKMIARRDTQQLDLAISSQNTLEAIRRGEV